MPSIFARLTINGKITTKLFAKIQSFFVLLDRSKDKKDLTLLFYAIE